MNSITDYIGNADAFPVLRKRQFFNHAGVSPLPRVSGDAIRKFADQAETDVYLGTNWFTDIEIFRAGCATFIGAKPTEIAFVKNTSEGISFVANGLEWHADDVIVTTAIEYPANIYPWMEVVRKFGTKLVLVPEEDDANGRRWVPTEKILEAASDPKCKLVTLSHIEFASGQRHEIARIGKFCRERGILFCIDAIQSLGVVPVNVVEMNIDYLSADGHKWMLGPVGAGIFYCREELFESTRPVVIGWMNVVDATNFGAYNFKLRPDSGRFECGSHNVPGLLGFKASIELLQSIGIPAISHRIKHLTDYLIEKLTAKGYRIVSPRDQQQWSGNVCFTSPKHDQKAIYEMLQKEKQTEIALRVGRLRASPHFYNTEEQMDRLAELLPGH